MLVPATAEPRSKGPEVCSIRLRPQLVAGYSTILLSDHRCDRIAVILVLSRWATASRLKHLYRRLRGNRSEEIDWGRIAQVREARPPLVVTCDIDGHVCGGRGRGLRGKAETLALALIEGPVVHVELVQSRTLLILKISLADETVVRELLHVSGAIERSSDWYKRLVGRRLIRCEELGSD